MRIFSALLCSFITTGLCYFHYQNHIEREISLLLSLRTNHYQIKFSIPGIPRQNRITLQRYLTKQSYVRATTLNCILPWVIANSFSQTVYGWTQVSSYIRVHKLPGPGAFPRRKTRLRNECALLCLILLRSFGLRYFRQS